MSGIRPWTITVLRIQSTIIAAIDRTVVYMRFHMFYMISADQLFPAMTAIKDSVQKR